MMSKIKAFFHKHSILAKSLILLLVCFIVGYVVKGFNEAFTNFDVTSLTGERYATKNMKKILYFNTADRGMYLYDTDGACELFTYTIKDGKIECTFDNSTVENPVTKSFYCIKDGIYDRKANRLFYHVSLVD